MKSGRVSPADAAKTLVAFANADGGTLLVGIHDGEVDGVSRRARGPRRPRAHAHQWPVPAPHRGRVPPPRHGTAPGALVRPRCGAV
ncbi:ATP-binding protein [Propioniciclava sinopodophylli]|uniref:AlbA family DNA-binding domain-containing protein n=1 Tax=Propioniciclava sinopodophylli TaxID=1837344 RepID=UPI0019D523A3